MRQKASQESDSGGTMPRPPGPRVSPAFVADIDALRGLCALLVLLGHAYDVAKLGGGQDPLRWTIGALRPFLGFTWVVGFVVLSGFCIELSCRRALRFSLPAFAAHRITRIHPMLVVGALIAAGVESVVAHSPDRPAVWTGGIDARHFLVNLWGAGGFFGQFGSYAPAYTVSYELLYYAFWGISRAVFGSLIPAALLLNALLAVAFPLLSSGILAGAPAMLQAVFQQFIVMIYLPWLAGAATAAFLERLAASSALVRLSRVSWPLLFQLLAAGWLLRRLPAFTVDVASLCFFVLLGVVFALVILWAYVRPHESHDQRWKRLLGELSYPLYLGHGPVIVGLGWALNRFAAGLPFTVRLLTLLVGALLISTALLVLVERPVMRLRRQFFARS